MNVLSKIFSLACGRRPNPTNYESLVLPTGEKIVCHVNQAIWAREIGADGTISEEFAYYFASTPGGKIYRLTIEQLAQLTLNGDPTKTAAFWSWRGEGECPV